MTTRYAIYYAPAASSTLHRLGSSWLGRDAAAGEAVKQPKLPGLREAAAEPCRYGFHATLKPPFRLRDGRSRIALGDAVALLASEIQAFEIPSLVIRKIGSFLALTPERELPGLTALAARCVAGLDAFRAPPAEEELTRRRLAGLSAKQDQYLADWGYPYVLDEFRFHLTLTGRLEAEALTAMAKAAQSHFTPVLGKPCVVDALTIFAEERPAGDFVIEERFALRPIERMRVAS